MPLQRDSHRIVIAGASSLLGAELKSLLAAIHSMYAALSCGVAKKAAPFAMLQASTTARACRTGEMKRFEDSG